MVLGNKIRGGDEKPGLGDVVGENHFLPRIHFHPLQLPVSDEAEKTNQPSQRGDGMGTPRVTGEGTELGHQAVGADFWSSQAHACPSGLSEPPQGTRISSFLLETHVTVIKVHIPIDAGEAQARRGWRLIPKLRRFLALSAST